MDPVSSSSVSSTESGSGSMVLDCEGTQQYIFEPYGIQSSSGANSTNESDDEQQLIHERLKNEHWYATNIIIFSLLSGKVGFSQQGIFITSTVAYIRIF